MDVIQIDRNHKCYGKGECTIIHDLGYPVVSLYDGEDMVTFISTDLSINHHTMDTGSTRTDLELSKEHKFGIDVTLIRLEEQK